jgi:hypothetical protein
MKQLLILRFILLSLFGIVLFSINNTSIARKKAEPVMLQITLNGIKPGYITVEQLLTVKRIRVFSLEASGKEKEYNIKFCRIALLPVSGIASKLDLESNEVTQNLYEVFGYGKPGDWLVIGNIKIDGLTDFKFTNQPSWTITDRKNK